MRASSARFSTPLRHKNLGAMVSSWRGCRASLAGTIRLLGPRPYQRHILVPVGLLRAHGTSGSAAGKTLGGAAMKRPPNFPALLESFFTQRLMAQRQASPHTIASYRDTFRLLLNFAQKQRHKPPSSLELSDIDAPLVCAFLDDLEKHRGSKASSRNVRLTAIRSFFRYAAFQEPSQSEYIQRVLAVPSKRQPRPMVNFLLRGEIDALLAAPDQRTWNGRRDHALLLLAVQTGLRLSELTSLDRQSIVLNTGAHVRCHGKGRKERCTPLNETNGRHFEDLAEGTGSREYPCAIPQRSWRAAQFRRSTIPARQIRRDRQ